MVLIAIGFQGTESGRFAQTGIEITSRGTIKADGNMMTTVPGVFAAGDANRGESIVVWAIGEGRDVAANRDLPDGQLAAADKSPDAESADRKVMSGKPDSGEGILINQI